PRGPPRGELGGGEPRRAGAARAVRPRRLRRERADLPRRLGAPPCARPPRRAPRRRGAPRGGLRPGPRLRGRGLRGRRGAGRPAPERALRQLGPPPRLRGLPGGDPDAEVSSCAIVLG